MARKSETGTGTQLILAILILFIAWVVLKWVIRVVVGVATTVVVVGAILFGLWIFANRTGSD
jgi:Flp pilus assembly protein TadB